VIGLAVGDQSTLPFASSREVFHSVALLSEGLTPLVSMPCLVRASGSVALRLKGLMSLSSMPQYLEGFSASTLEVFLDSLSDLGCQLSYAILTRPRS
jgi:hypothetical protein